MLAEKLHRLIDGERVNVIPVLAGLVVEPPHAQLPDDLDLRATGRRDEVGEGDADRLDVDHHRAPVIRRGGSRCDVCVRAPLVLCIGEVE
jgi:hypothetical protein